MHYIRVDGVLANSNYNESLDKEWEVAVSLVESTTLQTIEQKKITIFRKAKDSEAPVLSDVIAQLNDCKSFDEIEEKFSQDKSKATSKGKLQQTSFPALRIDGILTNPDYNAVLDKEWKVIVSQLDPTTGQVVEQREINIFRMAVGFDTPELSDVIAKIEGCKDFDQIIDTVSQHNPANSAYKKHKAQRTIFPTK
jgi:hypothetical protein